MESGSYFVVGRSVNLTGVAIRVDVVSLIERHLVETYSKIYDQSCIYLSPFHCKDQSLPEILKTDYFIYSTLLIVLFTSVLLTLTIVVKTSSLVRY